MYYILESNYNQKLNHHLTSRGVSVQYVKTLSQQLISDGDTVIVDTLDHESEHLSQIKEKTFRCVYMGDDNRSHGNTIFISKYQSIDAICSAIFDRCNLMVTIIGDVHLFERIMMENPNSNFIDFAYNPDFDIPLIQILDMYSDDLLNFMENHKNKILYPISNVMDLLDPPIKLIKPMVETLKKSRDTIVHIDQIKGTLDLMILNLSDLIIIVHEKLDNYSKQIDSSIEKTMKHKKIISLNLHSKTYDQFNLSEHTLCERES